MSENKPLGQDLLDSIYGYKTQKDQTKAQLNAELRKAATEIRESKSVDKRA